MVLSIARIIHDSSSRNRVVAWPSASPRGERDGHVEPRETDAYLKQYVEATRGEHARRRLVVAANPRLQQKCS